MCSLFGVFFFILLLLSRIWLAISSSTAVAHEDNSGGASRGLCSLRQIPDYLLNPRPPCLFLAFCSPALTSLVSSNRRLDLSIDVWVLDSSDMLLKHLYEDLFSSLTSSYRCSFISPPGIFFLGLIDHYSWTPTCIAKRKHHWIIINQT